VWSIHEKEGLWSIRRVRPWLSTQTSWTVNQYCPRNMPFFLNWLLDERGAHLNSYSLLFMENSSLLIVIFFPILLIQTFRFSWWGKCRDCGRLSWKWIPMYQRNVPPPSSSGYGVGMFLQIINTHFQNYRVCQLRRSHSEPYNFCLFFYRLRKDHLANRSNLVTILAQFSYLLHQIRWCQPVWSLQRSRLERLAVRVVVPTNRALCHLLLNHPRFAETFLAPSLL
jgi:hypothetical protein